MYLQIKKIKQIPTKRGFDTMVTHIGLYKEDGTYIKFIKHNDLILNKLQEAKIDITIPELEGFLNEQEIEKILPPTSNLFDNIG